MEQDLQFLQDMPASKQLLDQHHARRSNEFVNATKRAEAEEAAKQATATRIISHSLVESYMREYGGVGESSRLSTVSSSRLKG